MMFTVISSEKKIGEEEDEEEGSMSYILPDLLNTIKRIVSIWPKLLNELKGKKNKDDIGNLCLATIIGTGNSAAKQSNQVNVQLCLWLYFSFPMLYRPVKVVNARIGYKVTFSSPL